uniref:Uncharacterized protein n=1 Tax=Pyramimonas orientalis virus TaxID=455367 RepID=A0A7M3UP44_POV01|nr:hypothetical protein HWQ62_00370 [Pyramimonas orientalis virus]
MNENGSYDQAQIVVAYLQHKKVKDILGFYEEHKYTSLLNKVFRLLQLMNTHVDVIRVMQCIDEYYDIKHIQTNLSIT